MGILTYTATVSIDGYVADPTGDFDWTAPSEEVFAHHIERMAGVSTEVLGRRTYALMEVWEDPANEQGFTADQREFARRWRGIRTVVASSTLTPDDLRTDRDRLMPHLGLDELRDIVAEASGAVEIFGPTTAAPAIRAGLVEQFDLFVVPTVVDGGLRALPDGARLDLRAATSRRFSNGTIHLQFTPKEL